MLIFFEKSIFLNRLFLNMFFVIYKKMELKFEILKPILVIFAEKYEKYSFF